MDKTKKPEAKPRLRMVRVGKSFCCVVDERQTRVTTTVEPSKATG